jgi:hypothetical protein
MLMIKTLAFTVAAVALAPAAPFAQSPATDKAAVHQAALDYVEALYLADPARIERSVHPSLAKQGFYRAAAGAPYGPMNPMTYTQLVTLAGSWNKDGKRDTSIKKIEVLDVLDQTAVAKVWANWGIDHMQLAKFDGRWKIVNIVWQSHPPTR